MKYTFIAANTVEFRVKRMCHALVVQRSGYYAWRRRTPSTRAQANEVLLKLIREEHETSRKTYGSPRIKKVLERKGVLCGKNRVARLMRMHGIAAKKRHKWHPTTTQRKPGVVPAPNWLNQEFSFGKKIREQQKIFRNSSLTISGAARLPDDDKGRRNGHLLTLDYEDENLYPALRSPQGIQKFFMERNIHWWSSTRSGDNTEKNFPTRNMASSQIACINFLFPLAEMPPALLAMLSTIDNDICKIEMMEYTARSSNQPVVSTVEFEWIGLKTPLEEGAPYTRGENATSVDAMVIATTNTGKRRAYLFEWKYVEEYPMDEYKGDGPSGQKRIRRYLNL